MATSIEKSVKVNFKKFRSWKVNGYWTDPLVSHNLPGYEFSISRTFLPEGTEHIEADSEADMIKEVKKGTKLFKAKDLSEPTKIKFREEKISFEDDQGEDEQ